jgi:pyrroline-5-carboxylate reductase
MDKKKLAIIGTGNMGLSIIHGIINSELYDKDEIVALEKNLDIQQQIEKSLGISFVSSLEELSNSEIILLAVKPQDIEEVSKSLSKYIFEKTLIISVAAGVTTNSLQKYLKNKAHVIRAMPNTAVSTRAGVSALCTGSYNTNNDLEKAKEIFESLGTTIVIKENMFDIISALSGSGPAYFFYIIEALVNFATKKGFDKKTSLKLVIETCNGAVKLLQKTQNSPRELLEKVTSPNGSTAKAIEIFDKEKINDIIESAIEGAIQHNIEMGTNK